MVSTDHTAPVCPRVPPEPQSKSVPFADYQLYPLSLAQEKKLTDTMRLAGTALAGQVIQDLLAYSDAYKRAFPRARRNTISPWPLTPAQASGLHAALYYLRQYVGTLRTKTDG